MKMYKKYSVLLLVSSVLMCQNTIPKESDRPDLSLDQRPQIVDPVVSVDTMKDAVEVDTVKDTLVLEIINPIPVDTIKMQPSIKNDTVKEVEIIVEELKPLIIEECAIKAPEGMSVKGKPSTIVEAKEWALWMYKKANCYKSKNVDSCFYYTQLGIKTYEN